MTMKTDAATGFERHGDKVTLRMSGGDWNLLLMALGYATGVAMKAGDPWHQNFLALTNRLNIGNPDYTPYEIPEDQ